MANTSQDTLDAVIREIWRNQEKDVDGEKDNYMSNIADETGRKVDTVIRAVEWLKKWGLAKDWREGNRRCVRITWNPEKSPKIQELKEKHGGEPEEWNSA